jgi:Flp pilus assembly protein TadG
LESSGICRVLSDEGGQVLPWFVLVVGLFLGMSALVVDVANASLYQRKLQAATDAAALAAAKQLPNSDFTSIGTNFSSSQGDKNALSGVTLGNLSVAGKCFQTVVGWGMPCSSTSSNAVSVTASATVPTFFAGIFGMKTVTVGATSTAAKYSNSVAFNVAIIVDSTLSMTQTDTNCNSLSQEACALQGVQQMLLALNPKIDNVALFTFPNVTNGTVSVDSSCTTNIPASYTTGSGWGQNMTNYSSGYGGYYSMLNQTPYPGVPNAMPYTFPPIPTDTSGYTPPSGTWGPTYEVVGFSNDYRTSNSSTTLNSSSSLVKAAGGKSGCGGLLPSNYDGDYGTYYAGALYAAQAALLAEQANNKGSTNVMIVLGDGSSNGPWTGDGTPYSSSPSMPTNATQAETSLNSGEYTYPSAWQTTPGFATNSGNYPSYVGECGQAVTAAQYAANYSGNNTIVFTIAYGAASTSTSGLNGNCPTDVNAGTYPNITPCSALQQMSTGWSSGDYSHFYSDYNGPGGDDNCQASGKNQGITSLNGIFNAITEDLGAARLIPNNTY